jgi:phosphodiesterase/alkaline phosphatase D-like protein
VPELLLGPMLRYAGMRSATFWARADRPCEVEIRWRGGPGRDGRDGQDEGSARARTFEVRGHHYALVVADGLAPGTEYAYEIALDRQVRWGEGAFGAGTGFPASTFTTRAPGRRAQIAFGSCRNPRVGQDTAYGPDALAAAAAELARPHQAAADADSADADSADADRAGLSPAGRPDALLLIGDQVYADEVSPAMRAFIAARRDPDAPPGAASFEEYCALYQEAWSEPAVRWLLSVLPTVMIFDDHDVQDDWNTSAAWRAARAADPWWRSRITGAYASYWVYQHLGNLSPAELDADETWNAVRACEGDAFTILEDLALRADRREEGIRWSVRRDFGGVRVVMIDSRSRRDVADNRARRMLNTADWQWVRESVTGDFDHVVLATSVPLLLPHGIHHAEAWNEAVCAGAWGGLAARFGERMRQAADVEHWAAFGASFAEFATLLRDVRAGAFGRAPATVTVISGDIHQSYLAPVSFQASGSAGSGSGSGSGSAGAGSGSAGDADAAVWHAVCSPIRNVVPGRPRRFQALVSSGPGRLAAGAAARLAGARPPRGIRWRIAAGPWFANMLATLTFDGRGARVRFDRTEPGSSGVPSPEAGRPGFVTVHERELA